jgi:hypothetical protein
LYSFSLFSFWIVIQAATGRSVAVIDHNSLSGAGEKTVPCFMQNLVQGQHWRK